MFRGLKDGGMIMEDEGWRIEVNQMLILMRVPYLIYIEKEEIMGV
jgi:hypothetical protein